MFSKVFLAITQREIGLTPPENTAYMALRFSSYGAGLCNIPDALPTGSILLLDDSMPVCKHNPALVAEQLTQLVDKFSPSAILLDFQNEATEESMQMVRFLLNALPCPVAATEVYARTLGCPVFLSPVPINKAPEVYLRPWLEQGAYLELAPETVQFAVTEKGCSAAPSPPTKNLPLYNKRLFCHYRTEVFPNRAVFTLGRTKQDLSDLAEEAYRLGVRGVVGLYQELSKL